MVNDHPLIEIVRIDRPVIGPVLKRDEWYSQNQYEIFFPDAIRLSPELFASVEPFLELSYLSSGEPGSRDYRIDNIKICHMVSLEQRYSDYLLLKFLEYLYRHPLVDGGYYPLSQKFALLLKNLAGINLDCDDPDAVNDVNSSLFVFVQWL